MSGSQTVPGIPGNNPASLELPELSSLPGMSGPTSSMGGESSTMVMSGGNIVSMPGMLGTSSGLLGITGSSMAPSHALIGTPVSTTKVWVPGGQ